MQTRKYQQAAIDFSVGALSEGKRAVIQLPTGTGKTLVLLRVAEHELRAGRPVYVIVPTDEAVQQVRHTALRLGLFPVLDTQGRKAPAQAPLVITTYSCAWHRYRRRLRTNTLCLLDECHHINFNAPVNFNILNSFQVAIGLSATPWSKGCLKYFDSNRYRYKLSQAITDGVNSQFEIKPWIEPSKGSYQIIYTNDADYRERLCGSLAGTDYAIHQRVNARKVIARFRHGILGTIIVNRMLTEGFDLPQIKRVWIARRTGSRIAAMQMAGRALRPYQGRIASIYALTSETRQLLEQAIAKAG